MKAPNFDYKRPKTLVEAIRLLRSDGAVPLAGGQSLLATLNMRLSRPGLLVDIGELVELKGVVREDNAVRIGALTTHSELLRSDLVAREFPFLHDAMRHVAHPAIRNRGTIGGSVAYADPAAELPACMIALNADLVMIGSQEGRTVPAEQFFVGLFETELRPAELIVEFRVPFLRTSQRSTFIELARRRGDFAMAGLAAILDMDADKILDARLVYFGCSDFPHLATATAEVLRGRTLPLSDIRELPDALRADLSPSESAELRADTKINLATVLTRRAINKLAENEEARQSNGSADMVEQTTRVRRTNIVPRAAEGNEVP